MRLLDRLILPVLALGLAALAVVPDLIGIGVPGFGVWEIALLVTSLGLLLASLVLPVRPITAVQRMLADSKAGWREISLLSFSVVVTGVTADLLLGFLLPPTYVAITKYGWAVPADTVQHRTIEDTSGQFREVTTRYFQNGFKRWGKPDTGKRKMFVIGDSITEAVQVSNGEEWYSYLENQLSNVELYVYGAGGYGSLQEYMVFDDYIDSIHPDLILWQYCSNDYDNNLYELDLLDYPHNNHAVRPYLEENKIVYRLPLLYAKLRQYSFIADRLMKKYDIFIMSHRTRQDFRDLTEADIVRRKLLEEKSYHVTVEIMKNVKKRAKEIPIYFFNPCANSFERDQKLASETGIVFLSGIAEYMNERREGREVKVRNDGHWNKLGNQLAGERLVKMFNELDIMKE